ncbi:MAG: hypothetical protein IJ250_03820 [Bacteroidales bacterium]|nr:hypothetical protein [Bacteroidales bacterium]MBQ7984747.1 hypothetical protein [Bacteroidales bacterium]
MEYIKKKRSMKTSGTKEDRYIAYPFRLKEIDFDMLAEAIEQSSTVSKSDAMAVLNEAMTQAMRFLQLGHTVRFGDMGLFTPTMTSKSVKNSEDVTADIITNVSVRFTLDPRFKRKFRNQKITYRDLSKTKHV